MPIAGAMQLNVIWDSYLPIYTLRHSDMFLQFIGGLGCSAECDNNGSEQRGKVANDVVVYLSCCTFAIGPDALPAAAGMDHTISLFRPVGARSLLTFRLEGLHRMDVELFVDIGPCVRAFM